MGIDQTLQQAIAHHQAGEVDAAQRLYREVLQQQPQDTDASHNLGILLVQAGQPQEALPYFQMALEASPAEAQYWLSYINALILANQPDVAREVLEIGRQSGLQGEGADTLAATLAALATPPAPPMLTEAEQIQHILQLYQIGRFAEAEIAARELTEGHPHNAFGWKVLGTLLAMQGRLADAEPVLLKAAKLSPNDPDIYNNLGNLMSSLGRNEEAIQSFSRAIKLKPDYGDAHYNLGNALKRQNKLEDAASSYRRAISLNPNLAEAHGNLGNTLSDLKQYDAALTAYRDAIRIKPGYAEAMSNLGSALLEMGRMEEAEQYFLDALKLRPQDAGTHYRLGLFLERTSKLDAAAAEYRQAIALKPDYHEAWNDLGNTCRSQHLLMEAIDGYNRALEIKSDFDKAHNNLGIAYREQGNPVKAEQCFRRALEINPQYPEPSSNLGILQYDAGDVFAAIQSYQAALRVKPDYAEVYSNLGLAKGSVGLFDEAVSDCRHAIDLSKDYHGANNNLLFCVNYHPDKSGEEIYRYYEDYESRYGMPLRVEWKAHENDRDLDRRLKVGYVSPSFHRHSVRHFLEPLLSHHDHSQVEVYAYAEISGEDDFTQRYKSYADHWINTRGMSDAQLAERIRTDGIDILVDVAGHTGHNRLLVFARKPAPVSLHWLDFGYTTGLKAIDYYLTDAPTVPAGSEHLFSETPWRLPVPGYVYRPDTSMGEITPLPAQKNGHITFGTLTRSVRINERVIRAWSEILNRVPGSKLAINSGNFKDAAMQTWMRERFAVHGITEAQLDIGFQSPAWKVLQQTDISLDCFPHNSGTTLFESLYMGVPFITLANRPSVGTLGISLLHGIGHPEWSAQDEDEYIEKAVVLAQDIPALAQHRARLREEMQRSPLMDEAGFTTAVEQAYRQMWWQRCGIDITTEEMQARIKAYGDRTRPEPRRPADIAPVQALMTLESAPPREEMERLANLYDQGEEGEAEAAACRLTESHPRHVFAWQLLATLYLKQNRREQAEQAYDTVIALAPENHQAHFELGRICQENGHLESAIASYRRAIELKPDYAEAHNNLAAALHAYGYSEAAVASYRRAIELQPDNAGAYSNMGISMKALGRDEEAVASYLRSIELNPDYAGAHNNLGIALHSMGRIGEAVASFQRAIEINPDYAGAYENMGNALGDLQMFDAAIEAFEHALELNHDGEDAHNNLLYCVNYHPDKSAENVYGYYERYDAAYGEPLKKHWRPHDNDRSPGRQLKVGYVSPSFHRHSVRHFLEPLLSHHDHSQVEVYAYAEISGEDDFTQRYKSYADHWINTRGMSDAQLAERIRTDGIDILVDVAGHTTQNRLQVFARKPAPVSLHWLDFGYTTGLKAIDYYLTDSYAVPEGCEHLFAEVPWRLPVPGYVYRPDNSMGEVTPLPAAINGHITFGTLTRSVRINTHVVRVWSEILKRVPGSRLSINSGNFQFPSMHTWMQDQFSVRGIHKDRLIIGFQTPAWQVLQQTDISLDCFPHNSGTTLFESLYMGVPIVTLAGRPSVGTLGASILHGAGHMEWIADSEEAYIQKAIALAQDLPTLAQHRARLRKEMQHSPLMDETGFASAVEQAYRQMWCKWCSL